ncbi:MAG: hypothetical protein QNJ62_12370, partial [Methyloceanibacter sp.]|nr:hypothetical protein [Methyloceanibacter sp.]
TPLCPMRTLNDGRTMRYKPVETGNTRPSRRNRSRPGDVSVPVLLTLALGALVVKASLVATLVQKLSLGLATTTL